MRCCTHYSRLELCNIYGFFCFDLCQKKIIRRDLKFAFFLYVLQQRSFNKSYRT